MEGVKENAKNKNKKNKPVTEAVRQRRRLRNQRRRAARLAEKMAGASLSGQLVDVGPNATRSGLEPNPADPRTSHPLSALGTTVNGRRAVVKMLHPNGEHDTFVTKIPDGAATASVSLERRDEYNITDQFSPTNGNWDCIILHTPLLLHSRLAMMYNTSSQPDYANLENVISHAYEEIAAGSEPIYPVWGSYTTASINFHFSFLDSATLTPTVFAASGGPSTLFRDIRRCAYGSTVDYDAASLTDQGRVIVGQWSSDIALATSSTTATVEATTVVVSESDIYKVTAPPLVSSDMVSNDLKVYQARAKCGSYMPLRNWQNDFEFTSTREYRYVDYGSTSGDFSTVQPSKDLLLRGWGVGVELYMNINNTTSLRVKVHEDLELITGATSPYAPFSTEGFSEDVRALALVKEFGRIEPHAYVADYNDLNGMLKNIVGGLGTAVQNLGIPVISGLAPHIANLIKGLF